MTRLRSSLGPWLGVMRQDETPTLERTDRIAIGRHLRQEHDVIVLWRRDLSPVQLAAIDAVAKQILGEIR